jgi:hypothetical protein
MPRAYPRGVLNQGASVGLATDLTHKHYTILFREKHSSLLRALVNYGQKRLITLGRGQTFANRTKPSDCTTSITNS